MDGTERVFHSRVDRSLLMITGQCGVDLPEIGSRPEPDVFWVHRRRYRDRHPNAGNIVLAIEEADSSLEYDLGEKAQLYAESGLVEYWVIDAPNHRVHVMREPTGSGYQSLAVFETGDVVSPLIHPEAILDLQDLFEGE